MIYLDNNSTTKIDPRVLEAIMPFLTENYGNASSSHDFGLRSHSAVKEARASVAKLIGADENEIVFTSGATEAINLALKSFIENQALNNRHIISVSTEHPAVLDTLNYLKSKGVDVTILPVNNDGTIDLNVLESSFKENTSLVSIMFVNNETGVIHPIKEISGIVHKHNAIFMTDATQAVGKIPIDVNEMGIDLMCFSGHKFHAPKGVGGLYYRSRRPNKVKLYPLNHGGGQEKGIRSGTINVAGIVGIGKAAEISMQESKEEINRIKKLRDLLEASILEIPKTKVNGNTSQRIHNTSSISFEGVDADALMVGLKNISVSNGSACSSTSIEPSHVLMAMNKTEDEAFSTIRFSLSRFTNELEIKQTVKEVKSAVAKLREI